MFVDIDEPSLRCWQPYFVKSHYKVLLVFVEASWLLLFFFFVCRICWNFLESILPVLLAIGCNTTPKHDEPVTMFNIWAGIGLLLQTYDAKLWSGELRGFLLMTSWWRSYLCWCHWTFEPQLQKLPNVPEGLLQSKTGSLICFLINLPSIYPIFLGLPDLILTLAACVNFLIFLTFELMSA